MQKHTLNQILFSITASLILCQKGVWQGYLSVVIPMFKRGDGLIPLTLDDISWVAALVNIGHILTSFPVGYLTDRFGRIAVLQLGFISFLAATFLILAASTAYYLYVASLLVGLATSVANMTPNLYIAEIAKPNIRGLLGSIGGVLLSVASAVTVTFGPFLSVEALTWAILPCPLVGLLLTFFTVESPTHYFIRNNENRATKALARVRNSNKPEEMGIELKSVRKRVDNDLQDSSNFWELMVKKSNRKAATIVLILGAVRAAGGLSCVLIYTTVTLPADSFWDPEISMMIFSWVSFGVSLLAMIIIDRFGRKPLLIISLGGLGMVTAVSAIFYYCEKKTSVDVSSFVFVPHIGVILFGVFNMIGIDTVTQIHRGELLSGTIVGPVLAIIAIESSIIQFIYNKVYFVVERSIGVYFMFVIFSLVNFFGMIFTMTSVCETKGKTLEEIQTLLNR